MTHVLKKCQKLIQFVNCQWPNKMDAFDFENQQSFVGKVWFQVCIYFICFLFSNLENDEIVNILIEHGADINVRFKNNWAPLHRAAFSGFLLLLRIPLSIFQLQLSYFIFERKLLKFHILIWIGHDKIVETLIQKNANVNVKNVEGYAAMHVIADLAAHEGEVSSKMTQTWRINISRIRLNLITIARFFITCFI